MRFRRVLLALLLGSLSALIPVTIGVLLETGSKEWIPIFWYVGAVAFTLLSFVYLLLILLPIHLLLARKGWNWWWIHVLFGGVFAAVAGIGFDWFTGGWSPWSEYLWVVSVGMLSSFTFWAILRPRSTS